jgi:hypothetical protein
MMKRVAHDVADEFQHEESQDSSNLVPGDIVSHESLAAGELQKLSHQQIRYLLILVM